MKTLPYPLFLSALAICLLGELVLHSVMPTMVPRQCAYTVIGLALMVYLSAIDYHKLRPVAPWLYGSAVITLLIVMLPGIGRSSRGAQRWVSLGPLGSFQPSELAKFSLVIALAVYFSSPSKRMESRRMRLMRMFKGLVLMGVPFLLIAAQPDLGTAICLGSVTFLMLFASGASPIYLSGMVTLALVVLPHVLKQYQRNRLLVFLDPDVDSQGMGYNIIQAVTAVGSGGLWGQGLGNGRMSQHGFVPENWTDFIFTAVGEEMGLLGCLGMLLLFTILLGQMIKIALNARDALGCTLVSGLAAMIGVQAIINMGMTVGVLPVVGIPLPFVSYGGSAMLVDLAALGVAGSVARLSIAPWTERALEEIELEPELS